MIPQKFVLPSLMTWGNHKISDHNRGALTIGVNRIEESTRMANGTMRKFIIADKRTFSTDWSDLPQSATHTVDGYWGKQEIENWYNTNPGAFDLKLYYGDGTSSTYSVMMTKFGADISKRGTFDFWKVSITLEEV
jgi:hypothetical protein